MSININIRRNRKMNDIVNVISTVGFPIAVAGYLLLRQEGKMDKLTEAITNLTSEIAVLKNIKGDNTKNA
jgi:hypothetical protein